MSCKWDPCHRSFLSRFLRTLPSSSIILAHQLIGYRCLIALIAGILFVKVSFGEARLNGKSPLHLGFGDTNADTLVSSYELTVSQAILTANAPQLILTFLFLTFNSLYTNMLMTQEWFDYAHERKSLRVTDPVGAQRSTYRLQLPYKYGIPAMTIAIILHWLISQSLFLVVAQAYDDSGPVKTDSYDGTSQNTANGSGQLGYSPLAIMVAVIVGGSAWIVGVHLGLRRYKGGMPLVGSCSAAISAACHQPKEDVNAAELPLMWGVVQEEETERECFRDEADEQTPEHCCFTSFPVSQPENGRTYT